MNRGFFVWLVFGAACVGGIGWYSWTHHDADELHVQTGAVTSGPIVRRIVVAGTLQAVKSVDVGSQVSGQIKSLEADFNSIVTKGQVVAHIDPALFQAALDSAQAVYEQSLADLQGYNVALEDAQQKLARMQELTAKSLETQADLDAAKIVYDGAVADIPAGKATVTRAKGSVEQAQTNLDHTVITAPADGIIVNRAVDVGQTVAASTNVPVLFTIAANIEAMQVQALVDEADVGGVKEGQDVEFQVESYPDETFHGTISQVRLQPTAATGAQGQTGGSGGGGGGGGGGGAAAVASTGVTYTTIIDVANTDHRLRPGMTATAVLTGSSRSNATRLPNQALLFRPSLDLLKAAGQGGLSTARTTGSGDEELDQVWTFDGKHFVPIGIRLGLSDAQWVEEVSGPLKPGDAVVTNATYGPVPKVVAVPTGSPFGQPNNRGRGGR
jgi:HlyD family secretion protein